MKNCIICKDDGKYKCPTCMVYYCSATCCRKHREIKCEITRRDDPDAPKPKIEKIEFPTEDTVPNEKLELLKRDGDLKQLLDNPHLKNILKTVDASDEPQEIMQKAMLEPLFVEFADACLKVVEPSKETET